MKRTIYSHPIKQNLSTHPHYARYIEIDILDIGFTKGRVYQKGQFKINMIDMI